ncbi:MAG: flavodoxin family protein [Candidatus Thorarchaeota archaeon]
MVSILIVYDSKTGNTEKMAKIVETGAKDVEGAQVVMKRAEDTTNEDLLAADGIIVGSPVYYGLMSAPLKQLFDTSVKIHGKLDGKVGGAFASSGGIATGAETTIITILEAMLVHGMVVQGSARGPMQHYGAAAKGAPDEKEKKACYELGTRVAQLVLRLRKHS